MAGTPRIIVIWARDCLPFHFEWWTAIATWTCLQQRPVWQVASTKLMIRPESIVFAQLCPALCDPLDYSPPGSSIHRDSPGENTELGCHFLLQGIFATQRLSLHLLHWQADSLPLSHLGSLQVSKSVAVINWDMNVGWLLIPSWMTGS